MNWVFYKWIGLKLTLDIRRLFVIGSMTCLFLYTAGCSGTVSYHMKWPNAGLYTENGDQVVIDCGTAGVDNIYAYVYDQDGNVPVAQTSWACDEAAVPIPKVSSGEGYKVVVAAKDINDYALFLGEQENVTILSDTINDVGNIELIRFAAMLTEKTDDNLLTWSSVKYAKLYRIQIAEDIKFINLVVNRILDTTSYAPGLEPSRVYFWRVAPINSTGIEGRLSEIWSFRF